MRNLGTKQLFVASFMLFLIHYGANEVCLADPTDAHPPLSSIPKPSPEVDTAADLGMTNLIKFVQNDKERAANIGFYSADEVTKDRMERGSGIPVLKINAESLLSKPEFKNLSEYLEPLVDQFIYPIIVEGKARAVMNVQKLKKTGKWKAVSYGAPGLVSALDELKLLKSDRVFIARYLTLGIWLACTDVDDKSQCQRITANPKALDYKTTHKTWPKREPPRDKPIGEAGAPDLGAEAGRAGAYVGTDRVEAVRPETEAGLGRAEAVRPEAETELGRVEAARPRDTAEVSEDKKGDVPLAIIEKSQNGPTVLRSLADMARKRKPYELDDKTSSSDNR